MWKTTFLCSFDTDSDLPCVSCHGYHVTSLARESITRYVLPCTFDHQFIIPSCKTEKRVGEGWIRGVETDMSVLRDVLLYPSLPSGIQVAFNSLSSCPCNMGLGISDISQIMWKNLVAGPKVFPWGNLNQSFVNN